MTCGKITVRAVFVISRQKPGPVVVSGYVAMNVHHLISLGKSNQAGDVISWINETIQYWRV